MRVDFALFFRQGLPVRDWPASSASQGLGLQAFITISLLITSTAPVANHPCVSRAAKRFIRKTTRKRDSVCKSVPRILPCAASLRFHPSTAVRTAGRQGDGCKGSEARPGPPSGLAVLTRPLATLCSYMLLVTRQSAMKRVPV